MDCKFLSTGDAHDFMSKPKADTGLNDDFSWMPVELNYDEIKKSIPLSWNIEELKQQDLGLPSTKLSQNTKIIVKAGDTITCARASANHWQHRINTYRRITKLSW